MKVVISLLLFLSSCSCTVAQQSSTIKWYSETTTNGIVIQNSFPKGGPYTGATLKNFNYSYLIFFSRVVNKTATPIELTINFPADSFAIPSSPNTFLKIFLPKDTMTLDKATLFSYGLKNIGSYFDLNKSTRLQRIIKPNEEFLFYVGTAFYQTKDGIQDQSRGGNRAELVLKGKELFFRMTPQINDLSCGHIISKN